MRTTALFSCFAAVVAFLSSCASGAAVGPALAPGPAFPLVEEARISFGGELIGRPLGLGGDVVLSIASGRLLDVNVAEKKISWQFAAKGPLAWPACVGPDFVVAVDRSGRMTRLGIDGKPAWEKIVPGEITAAPALGPSGLLIISDRRAVRSFDPASGAEKWAWTSEEDIRSGPRPWNGRTVLLTASGGAVVLGANGSAERPFKTTAPASGPFLVAGGRIFVGLENGTVESWDLTTKKRRWKVKTGASLAADPIAAGPRIYLVTGSRQLFAVRARRGDVAWWRSLSGLPVGEAVPCGSRLLAPALSPVLTAYDPAAPAAPETLDLKQEIVAAPLVQADRVVVAVRDPATLQESLVVLSAKPKPAPPAPAPKKKSSGENR
jgi:hypothetical protein